MNESEKNTQKKSIRVGGGDDGDDEDDVDDDDGGSYVIVAIALKTDTPVYFKTKSHNFDFCN